MGHMRSAIIVVTKKESSTITKATTSEPELELEPGEISGRTFCDAETERWEMAG